MEAKFKHLEFIQAVVSRLAANSFSLRGWTVVVVSALFALSASDSRPVFASLALLPAIAFWLLDGYFLRQDRLYRRLYDRVRTMPPEDIDFSMDTSVVSEGASSWLAATFSKTLVAFHGTILIAIVVVVIIAW